MYQSKAVMQVKEDCLKTFAESEEMDVAFCRERKLPVRMVQSLMRLFAPLLQHMMMGLAKMCDVDRLKYLMEQSTGGCGKNNLYILQH